MSKPGFYNDNAYRSYPFIERPEIFRAAAYVLPQEVIVDAGFIAGLDAHYDDMQHSIYLSQLSVADDVLLIRFASTAPDCAGKEIVFQRDYAAPTGEWVTEHAESGTATAACAAEPVWSGFIVTGALDKVIADVEAAGGVISFAPNVFVIEPARVQNLNKAYLRSISVGNYARTKVPACEADTAAPATEIIWNADCLKGDIRFKAGYNTRLTQITRSSSLIFSAERGAGIREDAELCENHGEIPFYPEETNNKPFIHLGGETKPALRSKFLSGGWSCKDLIFTLNGVGGSNVNIVGGKNIQIGYDDAQKAITVKLSENAQGRCNNG